MRLTAHVLLQAASFLVACSTFSLAQDTTPRTFIPEKPDPYAVQLCPDEDERFRQDLYAASYRIADQRALEALNNSDEGQFIATDSRQLSDGTTLTLWRTLSSGSGGYFSAKVTLSLREPPVWNEHLLDGGVKLRDEADGVLLVTAHRAGDRICNFCEDRYVISHYRWNTHAKELYKVREYQSRGKYYRWGTWVPDREPPPLPKCGITTEAAVWDPDEPQPDAHVLVLKLKAKESFEHGRWADAEQLLRKALAIREKVSGASHPEIAMILGNLAFALINQQQVAEGVELLERARDIILTEKQRNVGLDDELLRELSKSRLLDEYVRVLAYIAAMPPADSQSSAVRTHAFTVAEQARGGLAYMALARAAARMAMSDPLTASLAREVDNLRNRRRSFNKQLTEEREKRKVEGSAERSWRLRSEILFLDRHLTNVVERLKQAAPKYAELAVPEPIDVAAVQKLLRPGEAILSFFTLDDRMLIWLVQPKKEPVYRDIEVKKADLSRLVARVRVSLDQSSNPDLAAGQLLPFDVSGAHELFKILLAPLREHLTGVKQLILVPDEVLLPLPFGALITRAEGQPYQMLSDLHAQKRHLSQAELVNYTKINWLAKEFAITVLPSATSLRALRQIPRSKGKEVEPLLAFGDPVLQGRGRLRGGTMLASRGKAVAVDEIRKMDRLPGTRDELMAVAKALRADPSKALFLGRQATKPNVMDLNTSGRLAKAQVVSFATHGLIGGEVKGLKEPALVLTPPDKPSEQDDGLLGLEEILSLKLNNADWVILSACNTAAPGGSGEGLSGLVRAFFFAGAPSLLVSHWSVEDRATQALMTEVFTRYAKDKTMPRAEALRQGMLALMAKAKGDTAYFAHPFAWAPFFLVGEGSN